MSPKMGDEIGGFELQKKLGEGTLASVWLALATNPKASVKRAVVKVLRPVLADHRLVRQSFETECKRAQALDHPNVVKVLACGRDAGTSYLAMEFINGVDLHAAMLAEHGPLPLPLGVAVMADAVKGLAYAHKKGVVHGGISPDKVMVDSDGRVRLLDFCLGNTSALEASGRGTANLEKALYLAPELASTHGSSVAADVFAFGATLSELVGGAGPKNLTQVMTRCTARSPKERFGSAAEVEAALRTFLQQFPPPRMKAIGDKVVSWKAKLADPSDHMTAPVPVAVTVPEMPMVPAVLVGGAGSSTVKMDPKEWEVDTDPQKHAPLPSVMLDPELEKLAVRHHGQPKQKKKPATKSKAKK
jgi:serine/threonine protein kinase